MSIQRLAHPAPSLLPATTGSRPPRAPALGARLSLLAVGWWATAAAVALTVVLAGRSLPVGRAESYAGGPLQHADAAVLSVWVAALAVLGALVALACRRTPPPDAGPGLRITVLGAGALVVACVVVLVDMTVLASLGYLPITLALAPFDEEFRYLLLHRFVTASSIFQVVALVGAVLLTVALVRFARRAAATCASCGRRHDGDDPRWTTPASAARWGRVATFVAAAVPAIYASTRLGWAAGVSLGFGQANVDELHDSNGWLAALGLGGFALAGAVLTLGLTQRWGEVFPGWLPGLAGHRVPVLLATIPPSLVAVAALPAGLSLIVDVLDGAVRAADGGALAAFGPAFLWPLWSVALGAATFAYWLRRRSTCRICGRG